MNKAPFLNQSRFCICPLSLFLPTPPPMLPSPHEGQVSVSFTVNIAKLRIPLQEKGTYGTESRSNLQRKFKNTQLNRLLERLCVSRPMLKVPGYLNSQPKKHSRGWQVRLPGKIQVRDIGSVSGYPRTILVNACWPSPRSNRLSSSCSETDRRF